MFSRKRKHRSSTKFRQSHFDTESNAETFASGSAPPDPALFIQAYEADVVRGPQAWEAAQSLEVVRFENEVKVGDGLIRWGGDVDNRQTGLDDDDEEEEIKTSPEGSRESGLWVDRYDARLLLDVLPTFPATTPASPTRSTSGWSDLPSDSEDTFFFSPTELEDYQRQKRRRVIDSAREERLRALREGDDDEQNPGADEWGGSDEEPDENQRELMRRTAIHLSSSPNPAQLEMRILANHGADGRFAFLRGRWGRAWRVVKAELTLRKSKEHEKEIEKDGGGGVLGGLAGYGDSDDDEGKEEDWKSEGEDQEAEKDTGDEKVHGKTGEMENDEALKAARRAKAREWAEKRRVLKASEGTQAQG